MNLRDEFPALFQFFGGWFNQDWDLDAADDNGVIRRFVEEEAPEQVAAVRQQLNRFLDLHLDESATEEALARDFGCDYNSAPNGLSVTEWLHKVAVRLN